MARSLLCVPRLSRAGPTASNAKPSWLEGTTETLGSGSGPTRDASLGRLVCVWGRTRAKPSSKPVWKARLFLPSILNKQNLKYFFLYCVYFRCVGYFSEIDALLPPQSLGHWA